MTEARTNLSEAMGNVDAAEDDLMRDVARFHSGRIVLSPPTGEMPRRPGEMPPFGGMVNDCPADAVTGSPLQQPATPLVDPMHKLKDRMDIEAAESRLFVDRMALELTHRRAMLDLHRQMVAALDDRMAHEKACSADQSAVIGTIEALIGELNKAEG